MLEEERLELEQCFHAQPGDVIVGKGGRFFFCGNRVVQHMFPFKAVLLLLHPGDGKFASTFSLHVYMKHSEFADAFGVDSKNFIIPKDKVLIRLSGPVNELFETYFRLKKKYQIEWELFSKNEWTFGIHMPRILHFRHEKYVTETSRIRHRIVLDICISLSAVFEQNYVMLEIIDWIDYLYYDEHKKKIALIEGVTLSVRKIRENRSINSKTKVL